MMLISQYSTLLVAYRACWREQWYTPDALKRARAIGLRELVEAAYRAPYYHAIFAKAGLGPDDFRSEFALQHLPVLEKAILRSTE